MHQARAVPEHRGADQLADEVDALVAVAREGLRPEARRDVGRELVVPALREVGLERARLHGLDAGDRLDQQRLVLGAAGELLVQARAQARARAARLRPTYSGRLDQHDQRQRHAVGEHHGDEDRPRTATSSTSVSALPVRKLRMFSSSRTRATESPTRRAWK